MPNPNLPAKNTGSAVPLNQYGDYYQRTNPQPSPSAAPLNQYADWWAKRQEFERQRLAAIAEQQRMEAEAGLRAQRQRQAAYAAQQEEMRKAWEEQQRALSQQKAWKPEEVAGIPGPPAWQPGVPQWQQMKPQEKEGQQDFSMLTGYGDPSWAPTPAWQPGVPEWLQNQPSWLIPDYYSQRPEAQGYKGAPGIWGVGGARKTPPNVTPGLLDAWQSVIDAGYGPYTYAMQDQEMPEPQPQGEGGGGYSFPNYGYGGYPSYNVNYNYPNYDYPEPVRNWYEKMLQWRI